MQTDPLSLLDQTIENLKTLSIFFDEGIDGDTPVMIGHEARLREQARSAIERLVPTLQAARITQMPQEARRYGAQCINCD